MRSVCAANSLIYLLGPPDVSIQIQLILLVLFIFSGSYAILNGV